MSLNEMGLYTSINSILLVIGIVTFGYIMYHVIRAIVKNVTDTDKSSTKRLNSIVPLARKLWIPFLIFYLVIAALGILSAHSSS
jgi:hypothetical protein